VRKVYEQAGVDIEDLPKGIYKEWRDGFTVMVNYTDQDYMPSVPSSSRIMVGSIPLKPARAIVWIDE